MRSKEKGDLNIIAKPNKNCIGFTYTSAKLWNMLPDELRKISNQQSFKSKIKEWVVESNIPW